MKKFRIAMFALIIMSAPFLFSCGQKVQKQTRFLLGSYVTIQIPGGKNVQKDMQAVFARINEIDVKLNSMREGSAVHAFNEKNIPINDPEIIALAKRSVKISEMTGGAFDVTLWGVSELWNFSGEKPVLPAREKIKEALKHSGYKKIYFNSGALYKKDPGLKLDFGGIAQGYAVEEALKILKTRGVKGALIDVSGDIYALGKLNGRPWKIGIRHPRRDTMLGEVDISDMAIITSGDYERFFIEAGKRYHHILDPRTGYPSEELISVTVFSSDPVLCDAMSTAFFVMGKDRAVDFAEKTENLDVLLLGQDEKPAFTNEFNML